jgi:hypothetical protein
MGRLLGFAALIASMCLYLLLSPAGRGVGARSPVRNRGYAYREQARHLLHNLTHQFFGVDLRVA